MRDDYARSLLYLDGRLSEALINANQKTRPIETFLVGHTSEIDINVKNVTIEDLRHAPYRATVEFEQVYYSYPDHVEQHRERYVTNVVFTLREDVPNAWIPVNPLGLVINYHRVDQAFE